MNMNMNKIILIFLCLAVSFSIIFVSVSWGDEKLLYATRYGIPRTYATILKTKVQVFAIDYHKGESKLVFSDEKLPIVVLSRYGAGGHSVVMVSVKEKVFVSAAERNSYVSKGERLGHSIYELFLDNSNKFRKVVDVIGDHAISEMFIDPSGNKIGYLNYISEKPFIFIHEAKTGNLLYKIDAAKIFRDCFASDIGWLSDSKRLFLTLDIAGDYLTPADHKKIGTYLMNEDGSDLVKLPSSLFVFPKKKGFRKFSNISEFIGEMPDGTYIVSDTKFKIGYHGQEASSFIYAVNPRTKSQKEISLKVSEGLNWVKLSPSGKYIAYTEQIYNRDIGYIWIKDLESGEESKAFSFPAKSFETDIILIGWIEN